MAPVSKHLYFFYCWWKLTILVSLLHSAHITDGKQWKLTSPSFPDFYPASSYYVYEIITAPKNQITLKFEIFDLENGKNGQCINDNVVISSVLADGEVHNHGKFCGFGAPPPVTSITNRLRVQFFTDQNTQKTGFSAIYSTANVSNGVLEAWNGTITSPEFPNTYPKSAHYIWEIISGHEAPSQMSLNFTHFDLEGTRGKYCDSDKVRWKTILANGEVGTMNVQCGFGLISPTTLETDHLRVEFHSDTGVEKTGFSVDYSVDNADGGTFKGPSKTITSPSFPNFYPANKEYEWNIIAGPEKQDRVKLTFTHFDLEKHDNNGFCSDYVWVLSVFEDDSLHEHGLYCGFGVPPSIMSVTNQLRIVFKSDSGTQRTGFSAIYTTTGVSEAVKNSTECICHPDSTTVSPSTTGWPSTSNSTGL